jgi:dTDP-D-glucose 4,6-dehydratase
MPVEIVSLQERGCVIRAFGEVMNGADASNLLIFIQEKVGHDSRYAGSCAGE